MAFFIPICVLLGILDLHLDLPLFNFLFLTCSLFYCAHNSTIVLIEFFLKNKSHILPFSIFAYMVLLMFNILNLFYYSTLIIFIVSLVSLYFFTFGFNEFKSKYPIATNIIFLVLILVVLVSFCCLLIDFNNLLSRVLMNSSNSNNNPNDSNNGGDGGSGGNNPGGPQGPQGPGGPQGSQGAERGGFRNREGDRRKNVHDYKSENDNLSTEDSEKLNSLKKVSYHILGRLENDQLNAVSYLELKERLIKNEAKRANFIKSLDNDRLKNEFLYNTTKITQFMFNEAIDN